MRNVLKYLTVISLNLINFSSYCQDYPINFYNQIKNYDLAKLWKANKLQLVNGDVPRIDFPEPLGFIGNNYQRFYIHYITIKKDSNNAYRYFVKGKTRVNNNICSFTGTITVINARISPVLYYKKYKQGEVISSVDFKEDSTQPGSGYIKGKLISDWYLDRHGNINYDSIDSEADGFSNNQCQAKWTSYKTHQSKKCNWGDFRIPNSNELDTGAGEFMVNDKYVKNGWENYMLMEWQDRPTYKKALAEEHRKWWE